MTEVCNCNFQKWVGLEVAKRQAERDDLIRLFAKHLGVPLQVLRDGGVEISDITPAEYLLSSSNHQQWKSQWEVDLASGRIAERQVIEAMGAVTVLGGDRVEATKRLGIVAQENCKGPQEIDGKLHACTAQISNLMNLQAICTEFGIELSTLEDIR